MIFEKDKEIKRLSEFILIKNNENKRLLDKISKCDQLLKEKDIEIESQKREISHLTAAILALKIKSQKNKEDLEREAQEARSELTKAQREITELESETSQLRIALARSFNDMKIRCDTETSTSYMRLNSLLTTYKKMTEQAINSIKVIADKSAEYADKAASVVEKDDEIKSGNNNEIKKRVLFSPDKEMSDESNKENISENEAVIMSTPSKIKMVVEESTPSRDGGYSQRRPFVLGTRLSAKGRMPSSGNSATVASVNIFDKENEDDEDDEENI